MSDFVSPPASLREIWAHQADSSLPPTDWVWLYRQVRLGEAVSEARLMLFAATRYRLWVNGEVVGHGPSRFGPGYEHFDAYDLRPWLKLGDNVIAVEARFIDANNYQAMPVDTPRFAAWGAVVGEGGQRVELTTPGPWRVRRSQARRGDATAFSFAIGPVEIVDQARWRAELHDPSAGAEPRVDGQPASREVLHVNVLALAYGLADADQQPALIDYVLGRLEHNAAHACRGVPADDFIELYFCHYALEALTRIGRFDAAERLIADHMSPMLDRGATTFWECLHRGVDELGSLCHAWSAAPLWYFSRWVLGVREVAAGQPDRLVLDPQAFGLRQASGVVPRPQGMVHVAWHRADDGRCRVQVHAPAGLEITTLSERVELALTQ